MSEGTQQRAGLRSVTLVHDLDDIEPPEDAPETEWEDEREVTWRSRTRGARPSAPVRKKIPLYSLSDMEDLPDPEWLIEGLVPCDAFVVLYGQPKIGKSFVALDWALSVAAGKPWLGHPVKPGDVVYVYAEGTNGLKLRADAWSAMRDGAAPGAFRAVPISVNISDKPSRDALIQSIRSQALHPKLIVIDTLARNFGPGDESKPADMSAFVHGCDELRAAFPRSTVLVVHHPGKDASKGLRGASSLLGAVDTALVLKRQGKGPTRRLEVEAQKDAETGEPMLLRLSPLELPSGQRSCVVVLANAGEAQEQVAAPDPRAVKTDTDALSALATFGPTGATSGEWRQKATLPRSTFHESRSRLLKTAKVRLDESRYVVAATH